MNCRSFNTNMASLLKRPQHDCLGKLDRKKKGGGGEGGKKKCVGWGWGGGGLSNTIIYTYNIYIYISHIISYHTISYHICMLLIIKRNKLKAWCHPCNET